METTNNQKQASARIRFALWRASRKAGCPTDYREMDLTQEQAVELLEKFNKETSDEDLAARIEKNVTECLKTLKR